MWKFWFDPNGFIIRALVKYRTDIPAIELSVGIYEDLSTVLGTATGHWNFERIAALVW